MENAFDLRGHSLVDPLMHRLAAPLIATIVILFAGTARAADAFVTPPSAAISQTTSDLAGDVVESRARAFERRNPGFTVARAAITRQRGDVSDARRTVLGAPSAKPVAADAAEARARAFVAKNADLLGLSAAEAAALRASTTPRAAWWAPRVAFAVHLGGDVTQRGFEHVEGAARRASISVPVADDGEVSGVQSSTLDLPALRFRSTPALNKDDPRVVAQLVGHPFERFEAVGPVPDRYESYVRRHLLAAITAADVDEVKLHLLARSAPGAVTYALAYAVRLRRGADHMSFEVDADTGAILRWHSPPGPVVP